jgi:hypothetical protein
MSLVESVRRGDLDLAVILAITPDAPRTRVGAMRLRWVADEALDTAWILDTAGVVDAGGALDAGGGFGSARGYGALPLVALEEPCAIRARAFDLLGAAGIGASVVAQVRDAGRRPFRGPGWPGPRAAARRRRRARGAA